MNQYYYPSQRPRLKIVRILPEGIYQIKRKSVYPIIEHHGVAVVGKQLEGLGFYDRVPRVFHRTDLGIQKDVFNVNEWERLKFVSANQAKQEMLRLKIALNNPQYDLFLNNCEHFSRFVMEGRKYSMQSQTAGLIGLVAATYLILKDA